MTQSQVRGEYSTNTGTLSTGRVSPNRYQGPLAREALHSQKRREVVRSKRQVIQEQSRAVSEAGQ